MEYQLYKMSVNRKIEFLRSDEVKIEKFKPKAWKLFLSKEIDHKSFRVSIFRFYISVLTFGKTEVWFATNKDGALIHSAYVIPRNIKYPFLRKNEWCIGPCYTPIEFRGGILSLCFKKYFSG